MCNYIVKVLPTLIWVHLVQLNLVSFIYWKLGKYRTYYDNFRMDIKTVMNKNVDNELQFIIDLIQTGLHD